jgi:HAE1 family hydrophobic/amphiphilic exporter-1
VSKFFVNRPIVAMVISIIMILVGVVALKGLPIAQYPEITPPEIMLLATYTGASAVNVEQTTATPIEQQLNGVERSIYLRSTNANDGTMQLRATFEVGTDLDIANVLVQNRFSQAEPLLPEDVKRFGVTVRKSLTFPLLVIAVGSPKGTYDFNFLNNYAAINIIDALARVPGVGQVRLMSGGEYAMRIWVRPDRLATLGITVTDIVNAVKQQNVLTPAGQIGGPPAPAGQQFTYTVRASDRLATPEQFGEIVIRTNPDGSQVRLKDVARMELGSQLYTSIGRLNGTPAAVIGLYQIPGSNALAVAQQVSKVLQDLSARFPQDVEYRISLDTTLPITEGITEITHTLLEAVVLVILVVFLFLQNWRATLIPLLTVPVSLIATFAVFPLLGFSVNTLSMLGLVLAIGIVVDDAIVVVEAVIHNIEHGLAPKEATLKAMSEVSGPVVAIAIIFTAVFVPVAFIPGITGQLYKQFAITIAISVGFSAFNALSLSPALSAMLLKPKQQVGGPLGKFFAAFNRVFDKVTGGYMGVTGILARKLVRTAILVGGISALAVLLVGRIPTSFVPEEDQGYIMVNAQLPDAASLERSDGVAKKIEQILSETPGIESYVTISGFSLLTNANSSNMAFLFVQFKPWHERHGAAESAAGITQRLNQAFAAQVPEAVAIAFGPPAIPGLGNGAGFSMMLQDLGGNSPEYLAQQTQRFIQAALQRPEIGRAFSPYGANVPQLFANVDRDRVLKLGLQLQDVNNTLGSFLGGTYVNDFNRFGRVYKVYVQAEGAYRTKPDDIRFFYVRTPKGDMTPLSTLVDMQQTSGPEFTNRFNLYRAAEVSGVPAPGYSSAQALNALEEVAKQVLPPDMGFSWNALSYQEKLAEGKAGVIFALAILLVFLILAAQYESWSLPFSVLLGTPFAAFGAFLGLFIARQMSPIYENNVFAQIGLVMLIGLAAKNAILIVEFARAELHKGRPLLDSALDAAKLRFRPILMTAFAFILGVVPLMRAAGAGAASRKVMGTTVFSGMLVATILGVILVPALFVIVERLTGGEKKAQAHATAAAAEAPAGGATEHGGHS